MFFETYSLLLIFLLIELFSLLFSFNCKKFFSKQNFLLFFRFALAFFFSFIIYNSFYISEYLSMMVFLIFLVILSSLNFHMKFKEVGCYKRFIKVLFKNKFYLISILFMIFIFIILLFYNFFDKFLLLEFLMLILLLRGMFESKNINFKFFYFVLILLFLHFLVFKLVSFLFLGDSFSLVAFNVSILDAIVGMFTAYKYLFYLYVVYFSFVIFLLKNIFRAEGSKFAFGKFFKILIFVSFYIYVYISVYKFSNNFGLNENKIKLVKVSSFEDREFDKNLVVIFLESFSYSFFEKYKSYTPVLNSLKKDSILYSDLLQKESSTIKGMRSSLCGGASLDNLNVRCLGHVLDSKNYHQIYMGGASLNYSSKGKFFERQEYDDLFGKKFLIDKYGKNSLLSSYNHYGSSWGVQDKMLFDFAFENLQQMDESDENFNLTMLTLDTHDGGVYSDVCKKLFSNEGGLEENGILYSVRCSDYLLGEFYEKAKGLKRFKDTVFVLIGDHPFRRGDKIGVKKDDDRILFMILNGNEKNKIIQDEAAPSDVIFDILNQISN